MRYFLYWSVKDYIPGSFEAFATKDELQAFLNNNASYGSDFAFTIVEGREIKATPVNVVKKYRIES